MADLTTLRRQRGSCKSRLTQLEACIAWFRESGEPLETLQTRIEFVQSMWSQFDEIQNKIEELDDEDKEREAFEQRYCLVIGRARALVNATLQPVAAIPNNVNNDNAVTRPAVKLPTMNLPVFDGTPEKWFEFRDSFQGLIDANRQLSDIQRMYYLRSSLKGKAAEVIESLESTAGNYAVAWSLIKKRFEDKRAISARHLQLLLDIPVMPKESGNQLRQTLDSLLRHIRALELLGSNTWDAIITHLMIEKFDSTTRREWRTHLKKQEDTNDAVTVGTLTSFLETRCSIVEPEIAKPPTGKSQQPNRSENKSVVQSQAKRGESSVAFASTKEENRATRRCPCCGEDSHEIYACHKFKQMSVSQKQKTVNELKLCRNCLRSNHFVDRCLSSGCKLCHARNNTLLHLNGKNETATSVVSSPTTQVGPVHAGDSTPVTASINCSSVNVAVQSNVLLSTARIWIYDSFGRAHECRVLLDSASQSSFLTKKFADQLKLATRRVECSVGGIASAINVSESACAVIQSRHTGYKSSVNFLVIEKIVERLLLVQVDLKQLNIPQHIKLADETFHASAAVEGLLGASIFWGLLCIGQIKLGRSQPILQKTHLGWIISGDVASTNQQDKSICCLATDQILHNQVEKFWKIDENGPVPMVSKNDEFCETHFKQTHERDKNGRFVVELPFRGHHSELGESRDRALRRFYKLERKLDGDAKLRNEYTRFMEEYAELNHMTIVRTARQGSFPAHYIPHHPVVTKANDHFKLRVVFDASAKTVSGKSLNDILRVGPTIQETLFSIVLRFRQHQHVLTADIVKMYRQVNIREEQRDLQRILWRPSRNAPIQEFQLNTVTYGLSAAPFLAIRTLHQTAHDAQDAYPEASQIVQRDFYVDDLLTGHDDLDKLRALKTEVETLLRSAGFELAKWKSNEPTLLAGDDDEFQRIVTIGEEVKTLGLSWAPVKDTFQYRVHARGIDSRVTKRSVLSIVSQIFDPLGLIGPLTIRAKIILQKLWQLQVGWDESLPADLHTEWITYVADLNAINHISVPRIISSVDPTTRELHGFSDASESAYGVCIYLRSVTREGNISNRLVCAKSRVAPLKTICIPRLELCGALLLARLMDIVSRALTIPTPIRHYWCDSTIVLAWILGEPYLRKTFVANRITEIQQLTTPEQWHHVRSEDNPADVISRGLSPSELKESHIWWRGPEWLVHPEEQLAEVPLPPQGEIPETKKQVAFATQILDRDGILVRYSSLSRLKRVIAYCLRWRSKTKGGNKSLSLEEMERAMTTIVRMVQAERFAGELRDLQAIGRVNHKSSLITLYPFLDNSGVIRVGGRLQNAAVSYARQHPIVLPSNHHITVLVVRDAHYHYLHAGAGTLLAILRESFWILSAKSTIRKILHNCIVCFRARPASTRQVMGDLPESRVTQTRAFASSGVDYGGPFSLKLSRNKTCKSYVCLFVCMSTKAIHLELVSDLSTPAFINALKRFIARRGRCGHLYSDNGSNFKGANNELRAMYDLVKDESNHDAINRFCTAQAIRWHFIPPYSPHMGGLWEAGIKSVKTHLRRILKDALLTFEEMYTVLTQVESVLNSQPLTPMSNDPSDLTALTPGHFLIGESLSAIPESDVSEFPANRLTRFQYLTKLTQQFWARWSKEYLSNLHQRFKWNREDQQTRIEIGTMVLLRDDQTPSTHWPLGRIIGCHQGSDGKTRVISVKTAKGIVKRALTKICVLPIES